MPTEYTQRDVPSVNARTPPSGLSRRGDDSALQEAPTSPRAAPSDRISAEPIRGSAEIRSEGAGTGDGLLSCSAKSCLRRDKPDGGQKSSPRAKIRLFMF